MSKWSDIESLNKALDGVVQEHADKIADAIRKRGVACRVQDGTIIMGPEAMTREYGNGVDPSEPFLIQSLSEAGARLK